MKKVLLSVFAVFIAFSNLFAEGTAQTSPGGVDRNADLTINRGGEYSVFAHTSSGPLDRLYLNVQEGETVYFGFQIRSGGTSTLRIRKNSDNSIVKTFTLVSTGNGYISSYSRAVAGPAAVAGASGYPTGTANTWSVAPGDSGLYYLEFSTGSPTTNLNLRYYDVTVVDGANAVQNGRLWAYRWNLDCRSFAQPYEGSFYSYTSDSTVAELDLNGFKPFVWTIMLNDFGPQTGGTVSQNRRSRNGNFGTPQYPLFLNDPDNTLYPTGGFSTVNTTNTPTITGCLGDYCINAYFNGGGVGEIILDLNGTPGFQSGSEDVYFIQNVTSGWNCFQWDGLDGLGNVATGAANISVTASVITGITHFPIYDAECNENGFEVRRVRPGAGNAFLLWDNTNFTGGTSDTIVGCLSGGSCNEWGPGTSQSISSNCGSGSFGDVRTINTWWYGFKDTAPFTGITVTGSIGFVTLNTTSITCNGLNNGEIDLDITGGEPPFSIAWSNGVNQSGAGTNYSITNLGPGTYDVTVTDNAGCTVVSSGTVNEPTALSVSLSKTDIDCFGESTGSINSTVTGGTELGGGGYSYSWSNGQSSPDISALPQGTYTVTVTDANGCTETASITVDQSPQLVLTLSETSSVSCFGGSDGEASASASGGQGPYTYAWSNGGVGTSQTGLQGGSYTVTATDNLGCQVIESVTINQPASAIGAVATGTNPTTLGGSDGEISLAISNGVAPYTITWTGGGPISTSSNPYVISGLSQGNYNITVVDDNGCTVNTSAILNDPSCNVTITEATTDVSCNGGNNGSASLTVTGANPPVSYTWSNGATTSSISGLTQGTYSYTVTDAAGCGPYNGSLTVNEPTALSVSITTTTTVSCNNGSDGVLQAVATGGTGSYTFVWNTTDNGNTLSGLSAGNYSVTVTDDNGCTANASTTLANPSPISITSVDSDVQCNGGNDGSIVLSVSGGSGGFTYVWSNGEVTSDIAGLTANTYTVTVTDANSCTETYTTTINEPANPLAASASITNVDCNGNSTGAITVTPSGGTSGYTYAWAHGPTTATITSLTAGSYTVTVTDAQACTFTDTYTVTQPDVLTLDLGTFDPVNCNGESNGVASVDAFGGTTPYTYLWPDAGNGDIRTNLAAGTYTVTVTDQNLCTTTYTVTMTEPNTLTISASESVTVSCNGLSDGEATTTVSGGNGSYTYLWSNGQTTSTATGLAAGTYTVTVTDFQSCTASTSVIINEPASLSVVETVNDVLCFGGSDGSISTSVTGGNGGYLYAWSTGATTTSISGLSSGSYSLTVTDNKGCTEVLSNISVGEPVNGLSSDTIVTNVSGFGSSNGAIDLIVSGGTPNYTYLWDNGATTEDISGLSAGWYFVTITDDNGCTLVDSALIDENIPPVAIDDASTTDEDVAITLTVISNDSDSDGNIDPSTLTVFTAPLNGTAVVDPVTGSITYTPDADYNGLDSLAYIICDDGTPLPSECDTAWWVIDVLPVNDCPVLLDANGTAAAGNTVSTLTVTEDTPLYICLNHFDIDGDDLTVVTQLFSSTSNGVISGLADGDECFTYTPNPNYNGSAQIRLRFCDDVSIDQCCQIVTINLNVIPVNDPPVALNNLTSTAEDQPITINPLNNDNDDLDNSPLDTSSVNIIGGPSNGSATIDPITGEITYSPDPNFNGIDTIRYEVCDLGVPLPSLCDTALIIIQVTPVNDPPVIVDVNDTIPPVTTPEDTPIQICLDYTDIDGDPASVSGVFLQPSHGTLSNIGTGDSCFTYTPDPNYYGGDTVEVILCDLGCGCLCDTTVVIIDVTPVNDPPVAGIDVVGTDEDVPVAINPLVNDNDDKDNLPLDSTTVAILDGPDNGSVTVDPITGEMLYTPNTNFIGNDTIEYEVCDQGFPLPSLCTSSFIYISINSDNDPPVVTTGNGNPNTNDTIQNIVTPEDTPILICLDAWDVENHDIDIENVLAGPLNGTVSGLNDGDTCFTYTPDPNYVGGDTVTLNVCDNGLPNLCVPVTIVIDVTPVNDPPVALDNSLTTSEEISISNVVISNDNDDADGLPIDTASFNVIVGPSNGTYSYDSNTGSFTYTPNNDFSGLDTVTYQICDLGYPLPSLCDTAFIFINVLPVNDPPIANGDAVQTDEDVDVVIPILANDNDLDGTLDISTISIISGPNHGATTIDPVTGDVTYSPQSEYSGPDQFIYEVCDDGMPVLCDTAIVDIDVIPVNDPPVAVFNTATTPEDTPVSINVLNNDSDIDGEIDSTTVAVVNPPVHGTAVWDPSISQFVYTPNNNWNGTDGFTYVVCDDGMPVLCDTTFVNVIVTAQNDGPIANQDNASTPEETPVTLSPANNDSDPEGGLDLSSLTILGGPNNGTATLNPGGSVTYTPNTNFEGVDSILYRICDIGMPVLCDTAYMVIDVTPVNDPPVAVLDQAVTNENTPVVLAITANDSDIDGNIVPSSFTTSSGFQNGSASYNSSTGELTYTPNNGFIGLDTLTYQICDDGVPTLCDTALVVVEVVAVNYPPVANNDSFNAVENVAFTSSIVSNDNDPNSALDLSTLTIIDNPDNGTASVDGSGNITYTSNSGYSGLDSLVYVVCDDGLPTGIVLCDTAVVYFNVAPRSITVVANDVCINDAPFVDYTITANFPTSGNNVTVTWLDTNLAFVQTLTNQPMSGTLSWPGAVFDSMGNIIDWPGWSFFGGQWVQAADGFRRTRPFAYVVVSVNPTDTILVNYPPPTPNCSANPPQPPVAVTDTSSTLENTPVVINPLPNDSDPDGDLDTSSVAVSTPPTNGSATVDPSGNITYTPNPGFIGQDTIVYQVCDLGSPTQCDTALVIIDVNPVNHTPVADQDNGNTTQDMPVTINPLSNDGDPDGDLDTASVVITDQPNNGSATVDPNGNITYVPNPGFFGNDTLIYQVCDQATPALCDTALVVVQVDPSNMPPVANTDITSTLENTPVTIDPLVNDTDPEGEIDTSSVAIIVSPNSGTTSVDANGNITYVPNTNFSGLDTLTYQICDQGAPVFCDTAIVVIDVINVPNPPVANPDSGTTVVDNPTTITPGGNDDDPDGDLDSSSVVIVTPPSSGTGTTDTSGNITYTPDPGFVGNDTIVYEICDLSNPTLCDTSTIVIVVQPEFPPIANDDMDTTVMNQPVVINALNNDTDANNDIVPSSITIITPPNSGTASINSSNQVSYTPNGGFIGTDSLVYAICDATANCDTATIYITVTGFVSLNCPADLIVNAPANLCGSTVNWTLPNINSSNPSVTLTRIDTNSFASGDVVPVGSYTIIYAAIDPDGNTDTCSFNIIVNDVTPPAVPCPSPITAYSDAAGCGAVVNFTMPMETDACGIDTAYRYDLLPFASGDVWPVGSYVVQWRYIDPAGLITVCHLDITVLDTIAPVFVNCPTDTVLYADAGCVAPFDWTDPTATDNCTPVTITRTDASGLNASDAFPMGTTTISYQAADQYGNTADCSFNVTVIDTTSPSIACPADITVPADSGVCAAVVNYPAPTASGSCGNTVSVSLLSGLGSGATFPLGVSTETYVVTDINGNTDTCSFTVTVIDTEAPVLSCSANITVVAPDDCQAPATWSAPTATDNCSPVTITQTVGPNSGDTLAVGSYTVIYTATDTSGNVSTCSFTVDVVDGSTPSIVCSPDISVPTDSGLCSAVVNYPLPTVSDTCGPVSMNLLSGLPSGSAFPVGTTTITYQVVASNGNADTCSFDITVTDNQAPVLACIADASFATAPGTCLGQVSFALPTATDNCSGVTVAQISGPASGDNLAPGSYTVSFVATDANGNTDTCSAVMTVIDNQAPAIACPADISVNNDPDACGAVVSWNAPTATDNCSGVSVAQIAGPTSGSLIPVGTSTVTYLATDAAGNTDTCSFDITVTDSQAPMLACLADLTVNNDVDSCGAVVSWNPPTASDNCPGVAVAQISGPTSGSLLPIGVSTVVYVATDLAGNTDTCSIDITVVDNQAPAIACPADLSINTDPGVCGATLSFTAPGVTDNCPGVTITQTGGPLSGSLVAPGVHTVTYTATDASGNTSICSFDITVVDNEDPVIACPADITAYADPGACWTAVNYALPTATDNCSGVTVSMIGNNTLAPGALFPLGTTTLSYVATDLAGNADTCSFTVTVLDTLAPSFTVCPSDLTVNADQNSCSAVVNFPTPMAIDNCFGVTVVQTDNTGLSSGDPFPVGTTTITYTATDASGNTATCSFDVVVIDTQAPDMNCLSNITVNADQGACSAVVNFTPPTATDNCGPVTVTQTAGLPSGSAFPVGVTSMQFVATDINGNTDTCSFQVIVEDTQAPVIVCPTNVTVNNDTNACGAIVNYNLPTATDNCQNVTITRTAGPAPGALFPIGTTTVTYVAQDGNGNADTCSFTVTVNDTEDPTLTCPGNITVDTDVNACGAIVDFNIIANDNCQGFVLTQTDNTGLSSGSFFPIGTTSLSYQVTDASGNTVTCSFDVTVEDNDPPTLTCPTDFTVPLTDQCEYVLEDFTQIIIAADNCGNIQTVTVTQSPAPGLVMVDGDVQTVTITATDGAGNTSTCTFDVSVLDAVDPSVTCGNIDMDSVKADVNCEFEILDYTAGVSVSDNCSDSSDFTITQSPAPGTIVDGSAGSVTVTVTVTGPDGFQSECYTDLVVECTERLSIPNGFSPNGDGMNDFFVIEGLEAYPNNSIKIFNRWGNLVYERDKYQNDWDGTASSGSAVVGAGERLPAGTYFYIFYTGLADQDPIQGYIYLNQ